MSDYISFINISSMLFFYNTEYEDNNIEISIENYQDEIEKIEPIEIPDEHKEEGTIEGLNHVEDDDDDYTEFGMQCFDNREEDILVDPLPLPKITSQTLNIAPNTPIIPTGSTDGVIAKIPVVLAQLVIPINIVSTVNLPPSAFEIKDIKKTLKLTKSILLQPTNVLFIKGFVRKSIKYSTTNCVNPKGKSKNYTTIVPFECSTSISFFTKPLDPIVNTKEIFQYEKLDLYQNNIDKKDKTIPKDSFESNQVSEEFFNETPFCKLISSKVVELNESINPRDPKEDFMQINENMVMEIRIEILQNQPIAIPPAIKTT